MIFVTHNGDISPQSSVASPVPGNSSKSLHSGVT